MTVHKVFPCSLPLSSFASRSRGEKNRFRFPRLPHHPPCPPFARGGKGSLARDVIPSRATKTRVSKPSLQVAVHTPKANVQCTTLDGKPLKSVRNRHQTNTILNTSHEPKSTTVLELKYRSYEMFTIIQEFTEKYRGFRGSLFSIHPLSGCERLLRLGFIILIITA